MFGTLCWIPGWLFGAQSWWIDINLLNWPAYTFAFYLAVIWRSIINGLGGALAGLVIALVSRAKSELMWIRTAPGGSPQN